MPPTDDLPLFDLAALRHLARAATVLPACPACTPLDKPGWESLPQPDEAGHLQRCGTLQADLFTEPTLAEYHPAGTRYWSADAPIAPAWFPYNRCELWQCPHCAHAFLRYTEYGGYYQEARIRPLQGGLLIDAPDPADD